jgi:hypothetical protein
MPFERAFANVLEGARCNLLTGAQVAASDTSLASKSGAALSEL